MLNICFLSSLFPKERENEIVSNSIGAIANANNALQSAFLDGLSANQKEYNYNIKVINMPNIGAFPLKYKKLYFKGDSFNIYGIKGINVPFFNLIWFKHYFKYRNIKRTISSFLDSEKGSSIFIVYDLYEPFLRALSELKNKYSFKYYVIVPDLPGYTGVPNTWLYKILDKSKKKSLNNSLSNINGYILLCDGMKEKLPLNDKPYIVIEGIFNSLGYSIEKKNTGNLKVLFYSGAMDERNGVLNLLKAFSFLKGDDYRLVLCGLGNAVSEILAAQKEDNRIDFRGQLPREEILRIQSTEATLLLNPRPAIEEFTKYSFPSKTMEYFASGTPTLMYQLPGVPNEYYNYCYSFDSVEPLVMANKIDEICNLDINLLKAKGEDARNFILNNKTPKLQSKKLLDFILNS